MSDDHADDRGPHSAPWLIAAGGLIAAVGGALAAGNVVGALSAALIGMALIIILLIALYGGRRGL